jgi:transketolase
LAAYKKEFPEEGKQYDTYFSEQLPVGFEAKLPLNSGTATVSTRKASENALASLMPLMPNLVGGSADLTGSNLTRPGEAKLVDFQKSSPAGRYFRFGVREHGMCAVMNGIDAHGGLRVFGGTFLNFVSYALGAVRLAALSEHGVVYVATHDSIGLGEDGPTHQPVETLASLRATPNMLVLRPADQTETSAAWAVAMLNPRRPSCIALSRQNVAPLKRSSFEGLKKGAYVVDAEEPAKPVDVIIISSGTEVSACVDAKGIIGSGANVRVVSMPSWELFAAQSKAYQQSVIGGAPVLSVEPFSSFGWERYSHAHAGLIAWGGSAPAEDLYKKFGLTAPQLAAKALALVAKYKGIPVPPRPVSLVEA